MEFNLRGLFHKSQVNQDQQFRAELEEINAKLDRIEKSLGKENSVGEEADQQKAAVVDDERFKQRRIKPDLAVKPVGMMKRRTVRIQEPEPAKRDDLKNPYWIEQVRF